MTDSPGGGRSRPSYDDFPLWRRYQPYFPEEMRCTPETMPSEEWWSWRGLDVHLDRTEAKGTELKLIVLHGAGGYSRMLAPLAVLAHRHGYAALTPDLPGYGLTKAPSAMLSYELWVEMVVELIDAERQRDGIPIVLFGVSLGGYLAYQAAARSGNVAGVIATTLIDPRTRDARDGLSRSRLLSRLGLPALRWLRLVADRVPTPMRHVSRMNRISNIPELAELCLSDPLGGGNWMPARFLRTLMDTAPAIEPEDFDVCPVLLAHPGADQMTDIALSREFFERLAREKRMVVLDGASHMPTEHPGIDQLQSAALEFLESLKPTHEETAR